VTASQAAIFCCWSAASSNVQPLAIRLGYLRRSIRLPPTPSWMRGKTACGCTKPVEELAGVRVAEAGDQLERQASTVPLRG